jgi:hypothetical protein
MALRDSGTSPDFAVGRNAIPSYNEMPSRSEWALSKITQLHSGFPALGSLEAGLKRADAFLGIGAGKRLGADAFLGIGAGKRFGTDAFLGIGAG